MAVTPERAIAPRNCSRRFAPLFAHERLSTEAVLASVRDKKHDQQMRVFGDPKRSVADSVLKACEHQDPWTNRMVLAHSQPDSACRSSPLRSSDPPSTTLTRP